MVNFSSFIDKGYIVIDFGELNSLFENENFEIEVYKIEATVDFVGSSLGIQENLVPLYFAQFNKMVGDGLYEDSVAQSTPVTIDNVEYYFDISVDEQIGDDVGFTSAVKVYDTPPNDEEPC